MNRRQKKGAIQNEYNTIQNPFMGIRRRSVRRKRRYLRQLRRIESTKRSLKHEIGGMVMTVIEFAEKRLNESCINDDDEAVLYWRAYLDGARAQKKEVQ